MIEVLLQIPALNNHVCAVAPTRLVYGERFLEEGDFAGRREWIGGEGNTRETGTEDGGVFEGHAGAVGGVSRGGNRDLIG